MNLGRDRTGLNLTATRAASGRWRYGLRRDLAAGVALTTVGVAACATGSTGAGPGDASSSADTHTTSSSASSAPSQGQTSSSASSSVFDAATDVAPGDGGDATSIFTTTISTSSTNSSSQGTVNDSGAPGSDASVSNVPPSEPASPSLGPSKVMAIYSPTYVGTVADYSGHVDSFNATCFASSGVTESAYVLGGGAGDAGLSDAGATDAGATDAASPPSVLEYTLPANAFAVIETIGNSGGTATPSDACTGGTQTGSHLIDGSAMTTLHVDIWPTVATNNFQIHLVSADGTDTIAGPGGAPTASAGTDEATGANSLSAHRWNSLEIPFSSLGPPGPAATNLALVKLFTVTAGTYFVDNLYLHD